MRRTVTSQRDLEDLVSQRVENLFSVRRLCCSESIIYTFLRGFRAGLPDEVAIGLGSGLCGGMGCGDGVCGALSGAVVALSHTLGPGNGGRLSSRQMRDVSRELHERFKAAFASTLCRDLTDPFRDDRKGRLRECARISAGTAKIAAAILVSRSPETALRADREFLRARPGRAAALLPRLRSLLPGGAARR